MTLDVVLQVILCVAAVAATCMFTVIGVSIALDTIRDHRRG